MSDMEIQALRDEIDFWRSDAAARLWFARIAMTAEVRQNGYSERAADISVSRLMPTLASIKAALAGDLHDSCEACGEPLRSGDRVWAVEDGGAMHERCYGEGAAPYVHEGFYTAEKIAAEIVDAEAALADAMQDDAA